MVGMMKSLFSMWLAMRAASGESLTRTVKAVNNALEVSPNGEVSLTRKSESVNGGHVLANLHKRSGAVQMRVGPQRSGSDRDSELNETAAAPPATATQSKKLTSAEVRQMLSTTLETIKKAVPTFIDGNLADGIKIVTDGLWNIVIILVSKEWQEPMKDAKTKWDAAFAKLVTTHAALTPKIEQFVETGEPLVLGEAIDIIYDFAANITASMLPEAVVYVDGIEDLVSGIVQSWAAFKDGDPVGGVQSVWNGVTRSVDLLIPGAANNEVYQTIVQGLDPLIGNLNNIVNEYKQLIRTSKICWTRVVTMAQENPSKCPASYSLQGIHCIPSADHGADCFTYCGKRAGSCEEFCGHGKACCKKGVGSDPCECKDATGYHVTQGQKGSAYDYYQCVNPGTWIPESSLTQRVNTSSLLDSTSSWWWWSKKETKCKQASAASLVDKTVQKKGPKQEFGSLKATCDAASGFSKACQNTCYKPCPAGYVNDGCRCKQPCSGTFPATFKLTPGMCAQSPGLLEVWLVETTTGALGKGLELWALIEAKTKENDEGQKEKFTAKDLTNTVNSFVNWGKQFAHGECPDVNANSGAGKRTLIEEHDTLKTITSSSTSADKQHQALLTTPKDVGGTLAVKVIGCHGLANADHWGLTDPYVEVDVDGVKKSTPTVKNTLNPTFRTWGAAIRLGGWVETFPVRANAIGYVAFNVWDDDTFRDELLGNTAVTFRDLSPKTWTHFTKRLWGGGEGFTSGSVEFELFWSPEGLSE